MIIEKQEVIPGYEHMVANFSRYGISHIESKEDMVWLLNVLQANEENLDSLYDFYNGYSGRIFCSIHMTHVDTVDDIYLALKEYHYFYSSYEEMQRDIQQIIAENDAAEFYQSVEDYIERGGDQFMKTRDGYVRKIFY